MKKTLTLEELQKLWAANEAVKGTSEYLKYKMMHEWKRPHENGKWSNWLYCGWDIAYSLNDGAIVKKVKDTVYLMSKAPSNLDGSIDRWTVTEEVNELLHIY